VGLLKKKASCGPEILKTAHEKAIKTLKLLTSNMISGDVPIQNIIDYYEEPTRENVIIMILRCKKMYEARIEVKRIIKLLIMQGDMITAEELQVLLQKKQPDFSPDEIGLLRKFHRVTAKLDSILAMFREDHKMFKTRFVYRG
jgi:hypothetical protein